MLSWLLATATAFDFSTAPLSSFFYPATIIPFFLVLIYKIQQHVTKRQKPYNVQRIFALHNLIMSILSLMMFIWCLIEVLLRAFNKSQQPNAKNWLICESPSVQVKGRLYFVSYLYYLSKYYELLDTVFLALKGKLEGPFGGLASLNVWHHAVVVFMGWWWLKYGQSLQFIGLLFNTSVHVIMYFYFYQRSLGRTVKWRNFITLYQIIQFVTSFVLLPFNMYMHLVLHKEGCKGQIALFANLIFNATLLSEFVSILRTSLTGKYTKKEKVESTIESKVIADGIDVSLKQFNGEVKNGATANDFEQSKQSTSLKTRSRKAE